LFLLRLPPQKNQPSYSCFSRRSREKQEHLLFDFLQKKSNNKTANHYILLGEAGQYSSPLFDFCKKIKQQNSQSLHIAWQSRVIFISVV
jgi:hypothetical protein